MSYRFKLMGMGLLVMIAGLFAGAGARAQETAPVLDAPNRARYARVSASGFRSARIEEIPMSGNMTANVPLSLPQARPRWAPRYAIDGSPLTWWASEEEGDLHWLQLDLGDELQPKVAVAAVAVAWGDPYAEKYRIMASTDGSYWKQVHAVDEGRGGVEVFRLERPLAVTAVRIEAPSEKSMASVSVVEVGVYGDVNEPAPRAPAKLQAQALGSGSVKVSWSGAGKDSRYFFRVYRGEGSAPAADLDHLVATTCKTEFTDAGLDPGRTYFYRVAAENFGGKIALASETVRAATAAGEEFARSKFRGVVEGFYNDPWPHQERLRMIGFLESAGFNYYIYAPKMEPYHRQWWRRPYPEAELKNFAELVKTCRAHNVTFNYGISPGLDFRFRGRGDTEKLEQKLKGLFDAGVRSFTLCFDDIGPPGSSVRKSAATRQARLVNEVYEYLQSLDPGTELFFVPTVYSRTYSYWKQKHGGEARYLEALGAVNRKVLIFWTGPGNVFSAEIKTDEAMELAKLWGRPVLIWDNYPVNDIALRFNIFTGPYLGRDPDLGRAAGGIFLNPMYLPNASRIALYTAGEYMTRKDYDPWAAYDRALRLLGGSGEGYRALKTIADCLIPHPVFPELALARVPVYGAIENLWTARANGQGVAEAEQRLGEFFAAFADNPRALTGLADGGLAPELMPASEKLALYGEAGKKCLELMNEREPDRRTMLRREILELQARAGVIPWKVADETSSLTYSLLGVAPGRVSALDDFIARALREVPR